MNKPSLISRRTVYLGDFEEDAKKLSASSGFTKKYSTGTQQIDEYLFGGYGRDNGYEIVVMYGDTGIGKSLISMNFLAQAIRDDVNVGLAILEDGFDDVSQRLSHIMRSEDYARMNSSNMVRCLPPTELEKPWTLAALLDYFEYWLKDGVQLILLDHIQFAFENAEAIRGENEFNAQRSFMQKLNSLVKKYQATIFIVSHINKGAINKGMQKIQGSGGIAGGATKVIELERNKDGNYLLHLRKARFTPQRTLPYLFKLDGYMRIEPLPAAAQPGAVENVF